MPELTEQWCKEVLTRLDEAIQDEAHAVADYGILANLFQSNGMTGTSQIIQSVGNDERHHKDTLLVVKKEVSRVCAIVMKCKKGEEFDVHLGRCIVTEGSHV